MLSPHHAPAAAVSHAPHKAHDLLFGGEKRRSQGKVQSCADFVLSLCSSVVSCRLSASRRRLGGFGISWQPACLSLAVLPLRRLCCSLWLFMTINQVYDTLGVSPQEVERFKNNPKAYQTLGIGSRTSTIPAPR